VAYREDVEPQGIERERAMDAVQVDIDGPLERKLLKVDVEM
jgi:hypothetical protein